MKKLFFVFFLICQSIFGQKFVYQSEINGGDKDGYKKIVLPVAIYNKLNLRKTDIRIYDSQWEEVPYIWEGKSYWKEPVSSYDSVTGVIFSQHDYKSSKRSTINITLPTSSRVDKIEFEIEVPADYRRSAFLEFINMDETKSRRKKKKEKESIVIASDQPLSYTMEEIKVKEIALQIDNEDNPPLRFKKVKVFQRAHSLVAYLEKNDDYKVMFGNKNLRAPRYDLDYFRGKIPDDIPVVAIKDVIKEKDAIEQEPPFYKKKAFIWLALIVVLGVLSIICFKMIKEMKK